MNQRLLSFQRLLPLVGWASLLRLILTKVSGREFVRLRVRHVRKPVFARLNNSDLSVLYQVFGQKECEVDVRDPAVIIDGGANVGYSTLYLAERYPGATIIAVEPSGDNCRIFRMNCEAFPNVRLVQGGIWSRRAHLELCDPNERGWMIQVREAQVPSDAMIEAYTIADLAEIAGGSRIDILKLDIEGTEARVFSEGDMSWLDRVGCLIIETHGDAARKLVCEAMAVRGFAAHISGEKHVFTKNHAVPTRASQ